MWVALWVFVTKPHRNTKRNAWLDRRFTQSAKEKQRAYRARLAASRAHRLDARPSVVAVVDHADPVGALAQWSREKLTDTAGAPSGGPADGAGRLRG